jgi:hypothetical protein
MELGLQSLGAILLAPTPSMWALGQLAGATPPDPLASTGADDGVAPRARTSHRFVSADDN